MDTVDGTIESNEQPQGTCGAAVIST